MTFICPVCGWNDLEQDPSMKTHEICPCCGTQFGYDDCPDAKVLTVRRITAEGEVQEPTETRSQSLLTDQQRIWEWLRDQWIRDGMQFWSSRAKPDGWNAENQLRQLEKMN